ncbi:MAG: replication factor C large subunit [Candidatus Aenigmarchaeota archaeon]|nr:replication factor C large subunit [Candidatus Aenigmarchaeota archaeon]
MWSVKLKPKTFEEFAGNKKAIDQIQKWAKNFRNERYKALILIGPTGSGKTTATEILAKELNFNIVETNASDMRSKKELKSFFGHALQQQSLFFKGKLVLLDEVDGISGQYDRGAPAEIAGIIKTSKHPVIMTATDENTNAVKALKKSAKLIRFEKLELEELNDTLKSICEKKEIKIEEKALKMIARNADGDLRAAINDLQSLSKKDTEITSEDAKTIGFRDFERKIKESLSIIFKTSNCQIAKEAIDKAEKDLDEMSEWIRENLPRQYEKNEDIAGGYNMLSRADIFRGRITGQQYYRYMVYQSADISCGVSTAKTQGYNKPQEFHFPSKIAILGRTKFTRGKENANLKNIGDALHCSRKVARQYLPMLKMIKVKSPETYSKISEELKIDL